jgi:hypothetical protein
MLTAWPSAQTSSPVGQSGKGTTFLSEPVAVGTTADAVDADCSPADFTAALSTVDGASEQLASKCDVYLMCTVQVYLCFCTVCVMLKRGLRSIVLVESVFVVGSNCFGPWLMS